MRAESIGNFKVIEKQDIQDLISIEFYLNRLDLHISEFGKVRLIDHNKIDPTNSLDIVVEKLNSGIFSLSTQYFSKAYDFACDAYFIVARDFATTNEIDYVRLPGIISSIGLNAVISFFRDNGIIDNSENNILDYSEYALVNSILKKKSENLTSPEISGILSSRNRDLTLTDGSLNISYNYLSQFIYDIMSLNDTLKESLDKYYSK